MLARYHVAATRQVLMEVFAPPALEQVVAANVGQDSLPSLFGVDGHRHFCDGTAARGVAYIGDEHGEIVALAELQGQEAGQRAALGRLLHTVQDFYAHTNYVDLWLEMNDLPSGVQPEAMDEFVRRQVHSAQMPYQTAPGERPVCAAEWVVWRDLLYYVPLIGDLLRRIWLPADSHEALHLDSPVRGERFYWAMALARQRTLIEYQRAVDAVAQVAGWEAVARFHGVAPAALPYPHKLRPVADMPYWIEPGLNSEI